MSNRKTLYPKGAFLVIKDNIRYVFIGEISVNSDESGNPGSSAKSSGSDAIGGNTCDIVTHSNEVYNECTKICDTILSHSFQCKHFSKITVSLVQKTLNNTTTASDITQLLTESDIKSKKPEVTEFSKKRKLSAEERTDIGGGGTSEVANASDKFSVKLDCSHFTPEELVVKTVGNDVIIHGKHEERSDNHGWVEREFTRRYALPEGCDPEKVVSSMTAKGVLMVEAPKKLLPIKENERLVPIDVEQTKAAIDG